MSAAVQRPRRKAEAAGRGSAAGGRIARPRPYFPALRAIAVSIVAITAIRLFA